MPDISDASSASEEIANGLKSQNQTDNSFNDDQNIVSQIKMIENEQNNLHKTEKAQSKYKIRDEVWKGQTIWDWLRPHRQLWIFKKNKSLIKY